MPVRRGITFCAGLPRGEPCCGCTGSCARGEMNSPFLRCGCGCCGCRCGGTKCGCPRGAFTSCTTSGDTARCIRAAAPPPPICGMPQWFVWSPPPPVARPKCSPAEEGAATRAAGAGCAQKSSSLAPPSPKARPTPPACCCEAKEPWGAAEKLDMSSGMSSKLMNCLICPCGPSSSDAASAGLPMAWPRPGRAAREGPPAGFLGIAAGALPSVGLAAAFLAMMRSAERRASLPAAFPGAPETC